MDTEELDLPPSATFRAAMRGLAAGVSLVACRTAEGVPRGMLATSVTSVSDAPPTILVCINRGASLHDEVLSVGRFCVNFLGEDDLDLARRFTSPAGRDRRFDGDGWMTLRSGAPVLKSALAALDCELRETVRASSHTIVLGTVAAVHLTQPASRPLVYFDGRFGGWDATPAR